MRRMNRSVLGVLLALSLLLAPVTLAGDAAGDGLSLVEWVQGVLDNLFGGEAQEAGNGEDDPGLPNAGPFSDPAG